MVHRTSRLGRWLAAAIAVHAAAIAGAAYVARPRAADRTAEPPADAMQAEIELDSPPTATAESSAVPSAPASDAEGRPSRFVPVEGQLPRSHVPEGAARGAPVASSDTPGAGPWTFSPTEQTAGILAGSGLDDAVRAGVRTVVAEESRKAEKRNKRIVPLFDKHDIELGLVPGSELVTLTRDRVRRSGTPETSHAVLEFQTDGAGVVASVRILEASSARTEWDEVAAQLMADARDRPLGVPAGAGGLVITMNVESSLKTVSGASAHPSTVSKILGAIDDPLDTVIDSRSPPQRVVAARIVDVRPL